MKSTAILEKLVAFATVSNRPNVALIDWIAETLRACGAQVWIIPGQESGKASLWARLGPEGPGGVVLAGHTDVVPSEGQAWTSNPFQLHEADGKLYGRGACDMKGFIACALALALKLRGVKLSQPLYFAFTHDEEEDMSGAVELVSWLKTQSFTPDWFWLGEPTQMRVVRGHKGECVATTVIKGHSAHSSLPNLGVNANDLGCLLGAWLLGQAEAYAAKPWPNSPFEVPYSVINLGQIQGGTASNILADQCKLLWQYRMHPGDSGADLRAAYDRFVEETLRPRLRCFEGTSLSTSYHLEKTPFMVEEPHPSIGRLQEWTGQNGTHVVGFATEASVYQSVCPCVLICGPGSIEQAHRANEFVAVQQLDSCEQALDRMMISLQG